MKFKYLPVVAALAFAGATPAMASSVVTGSCQNLSTVGNRCLFDGNITENTNPGNANSHKNAEAAYNVLYNPDITLNFLTASDLGNFGSFGSITGAGSASGTWTLNGFSVQYLAVKASNQFMIYNVGGVSSGNWDTTGIGNGRQGLSHLSFFGVRSAVPEPGTWAMLILGFGVVGAAMRRRATSAKLTFA